MKRYIRSTVQPAQTKGTTFYVVSLEDVIDHFSEKGENPWIRKAFEEKGWKAIDFHKHLYDSFLYEDDLYICVSDGSKIEYQGKKIKPEELPTNIDISELEDCIADGNDQIIHRYITHYEIKSNLPFTKWSDDLLAEGYTKEELQKYEKELQ